MLLQEALEKRRREDEKERGGGDGGRGEGSKGDGGRGEKEQRERERRKEWGRYLKCNCNNHISTHTITSLLSYPLSFVDNAECLQTTHTHTLVCKEETYIRESLVTQTRNPIGCTSHDAYVCMKQKTLKCHQLMNVVLLQNCYEESIK